MPDSLPDKRSNLASATYTAIALVFFFGVGLAGGAAYKVYFENGAPLLADRGPAEPATVAARPHELAARPPTSPETDAPDLARVEPSAPPALAPPPAPSPAEATKPHAPSASATKAAPLAQAAQAPEAPVPYAAVAPEPAAPSEHAEHAAPMKIAAVPPKKPAMAAQPHHAAPSQTRGPGTKEPQSVALRPPPTAPGNAIGPFRVQFGAFANEDNARRVQWAVEATGLKVDVTQAPGPSGHPLFFLRSPAYADYASALSAAQTVQHRVEHFVNAIPIEYTILPDHAAIEQQAQR